MKLLFSIFSAKKKPHSVPRQERSAHVDQRESVRGEVIKLSLRDTLSRAKVPADFVSLELLHAGGRPAAGPRQIHIRLIVRQWKQERVESLVQIEQGLLRRMLLLDPRSSEWVRDISWRFAFAPPPPREEGWSETVMSPREPDDEPKPRPVVKASLLDPKRERLYEKAAAHQDFSPTQPMF